MSEVQEQNRVAVALEQFSATELAALIIATLDHTDIPRQLDRLVDLLNGDNKITRETYNTLKMINLMVERGYSKTLLFAMIVEQILIFRGKPVDVVCEFLEGPVVGIEP